MQADAVLEAPALGTAACSSLDDLIGPLLRITKADGWSSDPDQLKQGRITARRLRVALELYGRWLRPKQAATLAKELDWLTARLGTVRDLDVGLSLLAPRAARDRRLLVIQEQLARQRREAEGRLQRRLTPDRVEQFSSRLRHYQDVIKSVQTGELFRNFAASVLWARHEQLCRRAAQMRIDDLPSVHAARRAVRRFRYDLECLEPWLPAVTELLLRRLKSAQAHLGLLTDCEALLGILKDQMPRLSTDPARAGVQRLMASTQLQMDRLLNALPRRMAPLLAPSFRRYLARAVG